MFLVGRRKRLEREATKAAALRTAAVSREESDRTIAELLVKRVDAFHVLEGTSADVIDAKATGLLVADIAAGTVLVAAHGDLGQAWIAPAAGVAVAAWFFLRVIRRRDWDYGPDLDDFLRETDGLPPVQAMTKMASDVRRSWLINRETVIEKGNQFHWGYRIMYWSFVLALLLAVIHTYA